MPVFLVLYQVLRGLTRRETDMGFATGWVSNLFRSGDGIVETPSIDRVFDPSYLNESSSLYQSLAGSTQMDAFGMDLSQSASQTLGEGILTALPFLLLIAIVGATGFIQQRQIQGRNPGASINPQQQMIMKIMPIFLPVISFGLPAGLVLYFAVSNLYRIGQQAFISRSIYGMRKGQPSVLAGKGGDGDEQPQQSFREMFGLARKNAESTAKTKATKSSKPTPAKSGARSKSTAKGSGSAKSSTATKTSTKSGAKRPPKSSTGKSAAGASPPPTLQPRARKNQKKR
jgi:YidC/Oxa1 family membrane protein insertase